jgi:hypothetical protein
MPFVKEMGDVIQVAIFVFIVQRGSVLYVHIVCSVECYVLLCAALLHISS